MPLLAGMALLLGGCGDPYLSALRPKGEVAEQQLFMIYLSIGIMTLVITTVVIIYTYVLIRFRKRKGQTGIPKQVEGNHKLEIVWTVIPIILLIILAVPTVMYTFQHNKDYWDDPDSLRVEVIAHQFWWEFKYPDHEITTAQDLVVPVDQRVAFRLTSADVNHSFWVPALAGKTDNNAGLTTVMHFTAKETGVFQGKCAELCGDSHALMDFKVKVVTQDEFDAWVDKMTTQATTQLTSDEEQGRQLFDANCLACHAVEANGVGAAPNLKGFASREKIAGFLDHSEEMLKEWIKDPQAYKPGNLMPAFDLNDEQLDQLVKYLYTLE